MSNLPAQSLHEQATTHADATMNAPHGKGQSQFFKRLMPCKDVLVDAIDERAIEIEEQGRSVRWILIHGFVLQRYGVFLFFWSLELAPELFDLRHALLVLEQGRDHRI